MLAYCCTASCID